ncbi:MAG: HupE/UreJ family protein [Candidatus Eisenbacteria bacterium]|uniref:HupE/UreJ family protein n=1 Tax=Eiseniibacteriota bacterium TaxID=2212470 RepID=A0A538U2G1_UNCEI|nr:MAG: HupE/UreJ family protein [Candidatus Eisenbacteria bacterium]
MRARVPFSGARITRWAGLAIVVALLLAAPPARAHDVSYSYADLVLGRDGCQVRLTVHRNDAARLIAVSSIESLETEAGVARQTTALIREIGPGFKLSADERPLAIAWSGVALRAERRGVELRGMAAWPREHNLHETYVNVYQRERLLRQEVLTDEKPAFDMYTAGAQGLWAVAVTFIGAGIHHIFIGPDHILFVIGLLLLGGGLMRILKIVSGFTIAHSITLALAALGVLRPPSRVIEPLIALSIVYVGLANLRARGGSGDRRGWIAFGFGFVHGFGFASVLMQFGLPREALGVSLAAFNIGVEIGQACIVLAVLPLLALLRQRSPSLSLRTVAAGSWGVVLAGGWWFVERVFFPAG